jgi:hypothetical protein
LKIYPHSSEINDFNEVSMKKPGQIQKFWRWIDHSHQLNASEDDSIYSMSFMGNRKLRTL